MRLYLRLATVLAAGGVILVADETGLSLAGVKKICLKLQECGILEREGSKKDGYWITK